MKCPKCHSENPETKQFCADCGTRLIPSEGPQVAKTLTLETTPDEFARGTVFAGRYEIIEELGAGGMGRVYRAFDKKIDEEVALKLIKPEIAADRKTVERFRNELRIARKISHPNVCRMYDLNEETGTFYITMEYVAGEDLKSVIHRMGILTAGKAVFIARQVAEGLGQAHKLGVVHRDLKPHNIMIDKEGNAKIMDFGIAKTLAIAGTTAVGAIIGTPEYMSPEQVEGKPADARADIYALGVILFEMLTGRVPFEGDTPLAVAHKHRYEPAPDARALNPQIPAALSRLILHCLEKEREKRYQTAEGFLADLEAVEASLPTAERLVPKRKATISKEITVKFTPKKLIIPASLILLLVLAAIIFRRLSLKEPQIAFPTDRPSLAILYFNNRTGDPEFDVWRDGLARAMTTKLSQSRHIRVLPDDQVYFILEKLNLLEAKNYSPRNLKEIAKRGRATHILRGDILKSGNAFRLQATLQEASRFETFAGNYEVEGTGEESFFAMVDRLAGQIKSGIGLSSAEMSGDIDENTGKITTTSPEAFKYYSEGMRAVERGDFRKQIELMEKAVAADPEFAMAYRGLGAAYSNLGYSAEKEKNFDKAFSLIDRVSLREKYLIQAYAEKELAKKYEAYAKLLELYPDDPIGNNQFGNIHHYFDNNDKALEFYEVNIRNRVRFYGSYSGAMWDYSFKGMYEKAIEIGMLYINEISDIPAAHDSLAGVYLLQGRFDLALSEVERALKLSGLKEGFNGLKGDILLLRGDFKQTEAEYRKMLEDPEVSVQFQGRLRLSRFFLSRGQYQKALEMAGEAMEFGKKEGQSQWETESAWEFLEACVASESHEEASLLISKLWDKAEKMADLDTKERCLYYKTRLFLKKKSIEEARATANELRSVWQKFYDDFYKGIPPAAFAPDFQEWYWANFHWLEGMIEMEAGNATEAVNKLKRAVSALKSQSGNLGWDVHALRMWPLGLAYEQSGDIEAAIRTFSDITNLTTGRIKGGDSYARSVYMLGKIAERQGKKGEARENYRKFLDLWKNADPGLPEVADAKARLAAISQAKS